MKQKIPALLLSVNLLSMTLLLTACGCKHENWKEADCLSPRTCLECGITEGETGGHTWEDATCLNPKTCQVCGTTEGKTIDHIWKNVTRSEPKTCQICNETEGQSLDSIASFVDSNIKSRLYEIFTDTGIEFYKCEMIDEQTCDIYWGYTDEWYSVVRRLAILSKKDELKELNDDGLKLCIKLSDITQICFENSGIGSITVRVYFFSEKYKDASIEEIEKECMYKLEDGILRIDRFNSIINPK